MRSNYRKRANKIPNITEAKEGIIHTTENTNTKYPQAKPTLSLMRRKQYTKTPNPSSSNQARQTHKCSKH
jgi:hypothetical protein